MTDLEHTQKIIQDLGDLVVDVIKFSQRKLGFSNLMDSINIIKDLAKETPQALPELKSLKGDDATFLAQAGMALAQKVLQALVNK